MKKVFVSAITLIMCLVFGNLSWAEDFIKVKGLYWNGVLDGDIKSSTKLVSGTELDFRHELGTDRFKNIPGLECKVKLPGFGTIIGSFWQAAYEGKKTIFKNINYAGKSYLIGEKLETDLDLQIGSLLYEYSFIPETLTHAFSDIAAAKFGLLAGVEYVAAEGKITSSSTNLNSRENAALPVPVIGLFTQLGVWRKGLSIDLDLGLTGIGAQAGDYSFKVVDAYAELKINVMQNLPVGIGYKNVTFEVETDKDKDFLVNLSVDGFYLFTGIEF